MKRFAPDTVAGWIIVVLVSGLAVTQVATLAINVSARSQTSSVLAHFHLAERMADLVRLVMVTPPAQRLRPLVRTSTTPAPTCFRR